ncbi:membrane frizzled-related protein-like [Watersipora subatra]|uniref:membrane frizzled-related protein-like n=1 Tax=Watersipora subatra TaxID=2589382 RepID=UPI00355B67E5
MELQKFCFLVSLSLIVIVKPVSLLEQQTIELVEESRHKRQTSGIADCGGNYSAPTGYFHTPGFPVYYFENTTCRWNIKVSLPYVRIKLEFVPIVSLNSSPLSNGTILCSDRIRVYKEGSIEGPYEVICGHGTTPPQYSTGSSMIVAFISDAFRSEHRGFMAVYTGLKEDNATECIDLEKM